MSQQKSNNDRWKDYLLKSSLPLEQIVSEKLEQNGWHIWGEYSYFRPNEQNIDTEFSIDLSAAKSLEPIESDIDSNLNLLIECKYNYPGTKWVFSSPPKEDNVYYTGMYCLLDKLSHKLIRYTEVGQSCSRGIVLTNTGSDPNSITHGLNQLRYGMPSLICEATSYSYTENPPSFFLSLLLVTNAELYVLKPRQSLETYQAAQTLEDVAERVNALIVSQDMGPHLREHCQRLFDSLFQNHENKPTDDVPSKDSLIPDSTDVIVVYFDALEEIANMLLRKARSELHSYLSSRRKT